MEQRKIAFIGAGNMATAIIAGLINAGYPSALISAVNRSADKNAALSAKFDIQTTSDAVSAANQAQVIVLGVKPQAMAELFATLTSVDWQSKLVISIAAGISTERLCAMANAALNLVRVMPNTPALVGEGMSGVFAPASCSAADKKFTLELMSAVGKCCEVMHEKEINGIIAAAGSAPAYFFLFMEAMQTEAERMGFSPETARALVQQTALGAAQMVVANPEVSLRTLRDQVTSKGGTTAQALARFEQHQLNEIVAQAMQAAMHRAEEMESQF